MKKILLLIGYLAGILVGSKFAKQPSKSKKKKPETFGDWARNAGEEIVAVHSRLLDRAKDEYWTEENKQYLFEKKEALMMYLDDFKAEAQERIDELKASGVDIKQKGKEELAKIYENRSEYLDKASNLSKQALKSAHQKLDQTFNELVDTMGEKVSVAKKKPVAKKKTTSPKKKPAAKK